MKIAACLITKNAEQVLERTLTGIRPHVDGIFIYDTGSEDGTFDVVDKLNETTELEVELPPVDDPNAEQVSGKATIPLAPIVIERGEWRDDFSWAREQSFAMPPDEYDWTIWLDDDDEIAGADQLRMLAHTAHPDVDGYLVFYDYAQAEGGVTVCQLWRERLMRRGRGFVWRNVVHEIYMHPDRPPNLIVVPPAQLKYVHHRPPDRYPADRNLRLLKREEGRAEAEGRQPDPRTLAYLGTENMGHQNWEEAARYLTRYLDHPEARWPEERLQCRHKLASCLRALGYLPASVEAEMEAIKESDVWAENFAGLAESYAFMGDWPRAERWAKRALDVGLPQTTLIINPLELTVLPMLRIGQTCLQTGRYAEAQAWLEKARAIAPENPMIVEQASIFERAKFEGELANAVMHLREILIRFDENEKALRLLEDCVPYVVGERQEIVMARAAQRENCRHMLEPEEYRRWYSEEPKESTVTDDFVPRAPEVFHRVAFLEHGLQEQEKELDRKPTLLDLGCNDFWVGAYFLSKGYDVDGVELNRRSYELALERAERFRNGGPLPVIEHGDLHDAAQLLDGRRYDAVSLFEVLEHVPDVDKTLKACEKLLAPNGRVYISTPNGAFEQGNIDRWHVIERKGHLRAIPSHDLVDLVNHRGHLKTLDLGQGLTVVSYTPGKRRGKIVFYAGGAFEHWSPDQANTKGLGGSETALVQVASRLSLRGWEVKVYADTDPAISLGAIWRPHTAWDPMEECDLMVVSRMPQAFGAPMRARARALWCHDHSYGTMTEELAGRMTDVVVLSNWERVRFARLYPYLEEKLTVIRNGIPLVGPEGDDRFPDGDRPFEERKPRCVYSSSADRGLDVLLELWPRIRHTVPGAELHVFYGWDVFDRVAAVNPQLREYKRRVLELVDRAGGEDGGVFMRGRLGQRDMYAELQQARVWAYPTAFLETSCIGAMEARAAGLAIVTSNLGALEETVGAHGVRLPWAADEESRENETHGYREAFVRQVTRLLKDEQAWREWHEKARAGVDECDWARRVPEWERLARAGRPQGVRRKKAAVAA